MKTCHNRIPSWATTTTIMARKSRAIPIIDPSTGVTPDPSAAPVVPDVPLAPNKPFASKAAASKDNRGAHPTQASSESTFRPLPSASTKNEEPSDRTNTRNLLSQLHPQSPIYAQGEKVDEATAPNIYARPFVPKALTVINTLPAPSISTPIRKGTNYDGYISASLGPAAGFLPVPPAIDQQTPSQYALGLDPRQYEAFFQHHLHLEAEAEGSEAEACSLYGHDVFVKQAPDPLGRGQTLCTLQVPGLRENNPYVEEEDVVQLRQLRYESDGPLLLDMSVWLRSRETAGNETWREAAPGWTNVIYFARVMGVMRATETLHLRVLGLPPPASDRTEKFNVQFQLPI